MPAPFTSQLCGYRPKNGNPNMSDNNDVQSKRLGFRLLEHLGVPDGQLGPEYPGAELEKAIVRSLREVRPDLNVGRSRPASDFVQYAHLKVFSDFHKGYVGSAQVLDRLSDAIAKLPDGPERMRLELVYRDAEKHFNRDADLIDTLRREMPQESLLKIDVSVGIPRDDGSEELAVALSAKWSLRTDRAQDCISQGNKLVAHRRGRMPHFAVVTIETRPSMLKILADGSGAVDCVYHLDLPALVSTINDESKQAREPASWSPLLTFNRILTQKRIHDFHQLVRHVELLPKP
ncbi:NgoMIV family type II restriction endonuclease [Saccharomonospora xinjiangensis]|uniref:NgoMIV family type II restriction endonuclease n=1 Tax=Saccharomonospora xinjiangensis TaxID=75294 RepID=UPI00106F947C|nr:NgoMIV family type II restriction endonuclease [Saccharomonospora xinjiangensis]